MGSTQYLENIIRVYNKAMLNSDSCNIYISSANMCAPTEEAKYIVRVPHEILSLLRIYSCSLSLIAFCSEFSA